MEQLLFNLLVGLTLLAIVAERLCALYDIPAERVKAIFSPIYKAFGFWTFLVIVIILSTLYFHLTR